MTFFAPLTASNVRSISSGRHWVRTWIATSSGIAPRLDDRADEVEIGLRGGGKGDLDLLEPHVDQELEHAVLALDAHRLDQRLIAVAKVDRAPDRRLVDDARGPLAVGQDDGRVGAVLLNRHLCHDGPWEDLLAAWLQSAGRACLSIRKGGCENDVPTRLARRASKEQGRRSTFAWAHLQAEIAEKINPAHSSEWTSAFAGSTNDPQSGR